MYSVILMTAMTAAAPETPQFFGLFRGPYACWGCAGCWGSCHGCWGGFAGLRVGWRGCYASCNGCGGCYGGYAAPYMSPPAPAATTMTPAVWGANYSYAESRPFVTPKAPGVRFNNTPEPKKDEKKSGLEESARLIIEVPSNAKLYVDGNLTKSGSDVRQFYTPTLEAGQTYFYDVKIEVEKDGKMLTAN